MATSEIDRIAESMSDMGDEFGFTIEVGAKPDEFGAPTGSTVDATMPGPDPIGQDTAVSTQDGQGVGEIVKLDSSLLTKLLELAVDKSTGFNVGNVVSKICELCCGDGTAECAPVSLQHLSDIEAVCCNGGEMAPLEPTVDDGMGVGDGVGVDDGMGMDDVGVDDGMGDDMNFDMDYDAPVESDLPKRDKMPFEGRIKPVKEIINESKPTAKKPSAPNKLSLDEELARFTNYAAIVETKTKGMYEFVLSSKEQFTKYKMFNEEVNRALKNKNWLKSNGFNELSNFGSATIAAPGDKFYFILRK